VELRQVFAKNLQRKRALLGQNQEAFAEALEISRSELQKYLNGTGNPTMDKIEQIAKKVAMDPKDLLFTPIHSNQLQAEELLLQIAEAMQAFDSEQRRIFAEGLLEIMRSLEAEQ